MSHEPSIGHYHTTIMNRIQQFAAILATILLLSSSANAQVTEQPPACPGVSVSPAKEVCPGWEVGRECIKQVVNVTITNPGSCTFGGFRIFPAPHSQGVNFFVCGPSVQPSRMHCAADPMFIRPSDGVLDPYEHIEFTVFSDRPADLIIESLCKEQSMRCSQPIHVETIHDYPNPYEPFMQQPQEPQEPTYPAPTSPYETGSEAPRTTSEPVAK